MLSVLPWTDSTLPWTDSTLPWTDSTLDSTLPWTDSTLPWTDSTLDSTLPWTDSTLPWTVLSHTAVLQMLAFTQHFIIMIIKHFQIKEAYVEHAHINHETLIKSVNKKC